jgi:sigma-B regulation protein RsbU (phosphoserine phosphatase)
MTVAMARSTAFPVDTPVPELGLNALGDVPLDGPFDAGVLLRLVYTLQQQLSELECQRRNLIAEYQHLEEQIRLASQVQMEMLPEEVEFDGVLIDTLYQPADRVSGDMYDITRLDETRLGLSLADASGHGMPAALLTVLLKRAFRGKEIRGKRYHVYTPEQVLRRVNRDILATNMKQCQFVTGLHAVYDKARMTLTFARGGLPYPILVRDGSCKVLKTDGPLIGAFEEARFETATIRVQEGDTVLFFTDGLEALLLDRGGPNACDVIEETDWYARLGEQGIDKSLTEIDHRLAEATPDSWPIDDVTVVALRVSNAF